MTSGQCILVVDDRRSDVWFIEHVLQKDGFNVVTAFDGRDGLAKVVEARPDLIILDTLMPQMNGFEVYRQLSSQPDTTTVPVLVTTSNRVADERKLRAPPGERSISSRKKPKAAGCPLDFLTKPLTAEAILGGVRGMLSRQKAVPVAAQPARTRPLVLFADDDSALTATADRALRERGYDVVTALDGMAGIRLAQERQPDMIFLDIVMPEQNGLQVLSSVRQYSKAPVIMLTETSGIEWVRQAMSLGADGYMIKPFSTDDLLAKVEGKLRPIVSSPV